MKTPILILALLLATVAPAGEATSAPQANVGAAVSPGQSFDSAEAALDALVKALRDDKLETLQSVLGPGSAGLVNSGDRVADREQRQRFLNAYDDYHAIVDAGPDRKTVEVGPDHWPLPIPLVQAAGRWHFDARQGAEELVNRRIGRNELAAIETVLAYVEAQKEFFKLTEKAGAGRYARRIVSTQGTHDGLYWPAAPGEAQSPLENLAAAAREDGYPIETRRGRDTPFHGYLFHIMTAQGPSAVGGAKSYLDGEQMTGGFAMIAWPVSYDVSGIMSFIVNQDGVIYQKDLGPRTPRAAPTYVRFDPDISWARVDIK
jgi:hypothetical protein